ncbi:hypothetical protein [Fibrobacter succinogenes]|uniref:hypothetical protein n=1 Tax=Fibrobacter succinogenes TaxID=833 RepID=UPI00156836C4|nr:hypothetical protein [Fibrobacter succinogenes]
MNLFYRSILPLLAFFAFFGIFLAGCLDAPNDPQELQTVESISIMVKQKDNSFSTILKVNPSDSATIKASVIPEKFHDELSFEWFYSNENKDNLLKNGSSYSFYPNRSGEDLPNKLIVTDQEGNNKTYEFTVVINTPPVLSDSTIPSSGAKLYGSPESAFLFEWYSIDKDLSNGDTLFHILEIDGKQYDVGTLLQVKQSGFKAGEHSFRIIVRDLYGDADTLAPKKFYVVDTLEAK